MKSYSPAMFANRAWGQPVLAALLVRLHELYADGSDLSPTTVSRFEEIAADVILPADIDERLKALVFPVLWDGVIIPEDEMLDLTNELTFMN